ncbi:MAG: YwaF family protein [Clostridia bacterium]|nr:YwaF family protein [Clostridia bacterium]
MDRTFSAAPLPYGLVHWLILGGILAAAVLFALAIRKADERRLLRLLFIFGLCMLVAEAWKQWFVIRYIYCGTRSMWFFPWQLCSMAMYCSAIAPFLRGKAQDAVLVFLCTFSVIGAVFALLFPEDMMRPQILLFLHSFLYHAVMLLEGLIAFRVLRKRGKARFFPALLLYLCMAVVAEIVNVASHLIVRDIHYEANMFYITPFYPSTQPVFDAIAKHAGIAVEIVVYLGVIALGAFGLFLLEFRLHRKKTA